MDREIAQQELSLERDRLQLLLDVNNAVASNLDLRQLLQAISLALHDVVPHDFTGLAVYDEEIELLRIHSVEATNVEGVLAEGSAIPMEGTTAGLAFNSRQTVLRERIDLDEFSAPVFRSFVNALGMKSACVVPLMLQDRVLGVVSLSSRTEAAFHEDDVRLLEQIASQLAIAVDNAINFQRAERERDRKQLLLEVSNAVVSNLSLKDLLVAISGWLRKFVQHDIASVAIRDATTGELRVHALDAPPTAGAPSEGTVLPMQGTPPGLAIETRATVLRDRVDLNEFHSPLMRRAYEGGVRSGCSVPLISHDQALGG